MMKILAIFLGLSLLTARVILADEALPQDLVRLKEQYQRRIEAETAPIRKVYLEELGKLQERLTQQGKLEDALLVKREREVFEAVLGTPGGKTKLNNREELQRAMENTTWSYVADVPDTTGRIYFVIFLDRGRAFLSWDNSFGTWRATAANKVEIDSRARGGVSEMTISADFSKWDGKFSLDAFKRSGERVGASPAR